MQTEIQQKKEIINRLNLVPENRLDEIDMFIRFVLFETQQSEIQSSEIKKEPSPDDDFFSICDIWENREIDANTLRQKAWRGQKW